MISTRRHRISGNPSAPGWVRRGDESSKPVQVGLSHFAAMCGMTEKAYASAFITAIDEGRLVDVLKIDAQVDLMNWIADNGFENGDERFCIAFRFSLNRVKDVALFCECQYDLSGDEAILRVRKSHIGLINEVPLPCLGLKGHEFSLCDLETRVG